MVTSVRTGILEDATGEVRLTRVDTWDRRRRFRVEMDGHTAGTVGPESTISVPVVEGNHCVVVRVGSCFSNEVACTVEPGRVTRLCCSGPRSAGWTVIEDGRWRPIRLWHGEPGDTEPAAPQEPTGPGLAAGWAAEPGRPGWFRYWSGSAWTTTMASGETSTSIPVSLPVCTGPDAGVLERQPTTKSFYDASVARRNGREVAFGTRWRRNDDPLARYLLVWNSGTGECFLHRAFRQIPPGATRLAAATQETVEPVPAAQRWSYDGDREGQVEVLVQGLTSDVAACLLDGWEEHERHDDGIAWLTERLQQRYS